MSIQNYPIKYIKSIALEDGTPVVLRPMHPSDADKATAFRASLTDDTVMARFLGFIPKVTDRLIAQIVQVDFTKEMAIVAEITTGTKKIVLGVGRVAKDPSNEGTVELAVIVVDKWQGKKLGLQLIEYMVYIAEDMGYKHLTAVTSSYNERILKIVEHYGVVKQYDDNGNMNIRLDLE